MGVKASPGDVAVTAPVDVLSVMRRLSANVEFASLKQESGEARAAIAELIEAARRAAIAAVRGDENRPGTIRNADLDALRAALARVGGAK